MTTLDRSTLGAIGFGAAPLGNLYRPLTDAAARATIRAAWDAGIRYFDTAPHYGFGLSEKRLGAALAATDTAAHAIVSTKVDRQSVVSGKSVAVSVALWGRRIHKKQQT